jgi:hypothetical protein
MNSLGKKLETKLCDIKSFLEIQIFGLALKMKSCTEKGRIGSLYKRFNFSKSKSHYDVLINIYQLQ